MYLLINLISSLTHIFTLDNVSIFDFIVCNGDSMFWHFHFLGILPNKMMPMSWCQLLIC